MFPGVDGFHWTLGHVLFLSLFFAVALTIIGTIASAAWRTAHDFRSDRGVELWWRSQFAELPSTQRRCRHELAGRVISRTCDNAFDCRRCEKYSQFAVLPATGNLNPLGLDYSNDRYYHRGHTWVEPAEDGTVMIGLDELASHIVGTPDSVKMPELGQALAINQTAWTMKKNGRHIEVRAPIEGTVIGTGSSTAGWYLKLRPRLDLRHAATLRHLLRGPEVHGWLARELERLQLQLRAPGSAPALADGGILMPDLMKSIPDADWDTALADTFLHE